MSQALVRSSLSLPSGARGGALRSFLVLALVVPHRQPSKHRRITETLLRAFLAVLPLSFSFNPFPPPQFPFPRTTVPFLPQPCRPQKLSPSPTLASSPTRLTSSGSPRHNPVSRRSRKVRISRKATSQSASRAPVSAGALFPIPRAGASLNLINPAPDPMSTSGGTAALGP